MRENIVSDKQYHCTVVQGSAVAQWESVGLRSERSGVRYLPPPCCVLEQDTLLPESTG